MIETKDVTITSVSVTIEAIKVNNRQMTQSVFTQLPRVTDLVRMYDRDGHLLDDYELTGKIWGWVNWCPKGEDPGLRQFVVEKNGVLCRAASPPGRVSLHHPKGHDEDTQEKFWTLYQHLTILAFAIIAQAIKEKAERNPSYGAEGLKLGTFPPFEDIRIRQCYKDSSSGVKLWIKSHPDLDAVWNPKHSYILSSNGYGDHNWREGTDEFVRATEEVTVSESREAVQKQVNELTAHVEKLNKIRSVLRDFKQLFIAV